MPLPASTPLQQYSLCFTGTQALWLVPSFVIIIIAMLVRHSSVFSHRPNGFRRVQTDDDVWPGLVSYGDSDSESDSCYDIPPSPPRSPSDDEDDPTPLGLMLEEADYLRRLEQVSEVGWFW